MTTTELTYPFFEANQVLTNDHLNELFEYLDDQQRLTRANLIGVGIACGLEVTVAPGTIHLSKGCGVTTEGYLILQPADLDLVAVRPYTLPSDDQYPPLWNATTQQQDDLWELCVDDVPGTQPLVGSSLVLDHKVVVLFLELRKAELRSCSANSCDDRGAEVTTTLRPLLVDVADLDRTLAALGSVALGRATDLGDDVTERLALPDLRMPRVDVPATGLPSTEALYAAFRATFRQDQLAHAVGGALRDLYAAFRPLVRDLYPNDPFVGFVPRFGFLDAGSVAPHRVHFLQYYWDLFDDLLAAYDELRWKGVDLLCACCPPQELFPRHLMAGLLDPSIRSDPRTYRNRFVPSPAVGDCEDRARVVRTLFRRLVTMLERFTDTPPLPEATDPTSDAQIRITPSRWGDAPLSGKAIPYYYGPQGTPRLHQVWDPIQADRNRPSQSLSYRADEYDPPAPPFVVEPLRFDLEPNDFLRIEGHLGKDVRGVLETLLKAKQHHRLPIEVVALRTGAFDENVDIDLSKERCRFEDLDTLYQTLRGELSCTLAKQVGYLYDLPDDDAPEAEHPSGPALTLLQDWAPEHVVRPKTLGSRLENILATPVPQWSRLTGGSEDVAAHVLPLVASMSAMAASVGPDIGRLDLTTFSERYTEVVASAKQLQDAHLTKVTDRAGLSSRLDDIVSKCRLDPLQALEAEYKRRIREVKQAQFLTHFLERHAGIQHKAGVPLGGTFVLVYHGPATAPPAPVATPTPTPVDPIGPIGPFHPDWGLGTIGPGVISVVHPTLDPDPRLGDISPLVDPTPHEVSPIEVLGNPAESPGLGIAGRITRIINTPGVATTGLNPELVDRGLIDRGLVNRSLGLEGRPTRVAAAPMRRAPLEELVERLPYRTGMADDPDIRRVYEAVTGRPMVPRRVVSTGEERTYLDAVAALTNGTVVADFFLPYLCCSDCAPIQYTLAPAHVTLRAHRHCTNPDSRAEVDLETEGGTGAMSVRVDDGPFEASTGTVVLSVGAHTLVVRDGVGTESDPVQLTIPPPLAISEPQVQEDDGGSGTFVVSLRVSGGTPPYSADAGTIDGDAYTSPRLKREESRTVTIQDTNGCTIEVPLGSGTDPCGLPCGGAAVRRGYRFWVPEPQERLPLKSYQPKVDQLRVGDIDLTGEAQAVLDDGRDAIRTADFPGLVQRWLDGLNQLIAEAVGSDQWVHLDYDAADAKSTTGILWIDHLECIPFDLRLSVAYVQGRREEQRSYEYTPEGTFVQGDQDLVRIPAFDGSTSNKCHPDDKPVPICRKPEMKVEIRHSGVFPEPIVLMAMPTGGEDPASFLWEVDDATPALASEREVQVSFGSEEPSKKTVRLTVFTERGCRVVVQKQVDIFKPDA